MSEISVDLHPSRLTLWSRCEVRAVAEERDAPEDDSVGVAAWIGSAIHRAVADGGFETEPEAPEMLRYDQLTPNYRTALYQIRVMAMVMMRSVEASGIRSLAVEEEAQTRFDWAPWLRVIGTADMRGVLHADGVIVDFKTGRSLEAAWLQIGAYALMREGIEFGAVFHLQRAAPFKIAEQAIYDIRPIGPIADAAEAAMKRVARLHNDPDMATYSPGAWCALCSVEDCPVRVHPFKWRSR